MGACVTGRTSSPDLTLATTVADFLAVALRREDPDTLFFSRRLSIEGDTELGLLVKNTLDALDLRAHGCQPLRACSICLDLVSAKRNHAYRA